MTLPPKRPGTATLALSPWRRGGAGTFLPHPLLVVSRKLALFLKSATLPPASAPTGLQQAFLSQTPTERPPLLLGPRGCLKEGGQKSRDQAPLAP